MSVGVPTTQHKGNCRQYQLYFTKAITTINAFTILSVSRYTNQRLSTNREGIALHFLDNLLNLYKVYNDETKRKLENIIRGSLIEGTSDYCTAVRNFLCASFSTSTTVKRDFESKLLIKKEQESGLRDYATQNQFWVTHLPAQYLTRGGESQVYLDIDSKHVVKINDAIYYATWLEYFNSVLS